MNLIIHAVDMLEHLLELEYQFGKLPEYRPALEDVLAYYQMVLKSLIDIVCL